MKLAALRRDRGLTQTELADMVGVEQATISKIERGNTAVTLRLLQRIADALDLQVSDFFVDERTYQEQLLLQAFRALPTERQRGWLDLAQLVVEDEGEPLP